MPRPATADAALAERSECWAAAALGLAAWPAAVRMAGSDGGDGSSVEEEEGSPPSPSPPPSSPPAVSPPPPPPPADAGASLDELLARMMAASVKTIPPPGPTCACCGRPKRPPVVVAATPPKPRSPSPPPSTCGGVWGAPAGDRDRRPLARVDRVQRYHTTAAAWAADPFLAVGGDTRAPRRPRGALTAAFAAEHATCPPLVVRRVVRRGQENVGV